MKIACLILTAVVLGAPAAQAQFGGDPFGGDGFGTKPFGEKATAAPTAKPDSHTAMQRWRIGVKVRAQAPCVGIKATLPVPMDWPGEQSVQIREDLTDMSSHVAKHEFRTIDGVKQLLVSIPMLRPGEVAHAFMTFEVTKQAVHPPENVVALQVPRSLPREFRSSYMGKSPYIEATDPRIKKKAKELVQGKTGAWEKVETIYDWVRAHVEYKNGELKGAVAALKEGQGDCEELTSLFVALCRANRIPARTVWIEGHCYPEFYLLDENNKGRWYPCQSAGTRSFGGMFDKRLILQKGDKFDVPEKKADQHYVAEHLSAKSVRGSPPIVQWVRTLALDDAPVARRP